MGTKTKSEHAAKTNNGQQFCYKCQTWMTFKNFNLESKFCNGCYVDKKNKLRSCLRCDRAFSTNNDYRVCYRCKSDEEWRDGDVTY